jgi:hypothetical protein
LLIANPNPVPPYLRVVDESARERLEQPTHALARQADPGIAHREMQLHLVALRGRGRDGEHDLALLGELHRVGQQIEQDLAQPRYVRADRDRHLALEQIRRVELLLGRAPPDQIERGLHAFAQVERLRLDVHAPGLDLGEVEDVVDDGEQRVAAVADGGCVVALLVVKRGVEQQPAHADDRVHRRADLVAHCSQEGALGFVGRFGRGTRFLRGTEQPRVLDRDHRLVGEAAQQVRFAVGERNHRHPQKADGAQPFLAVHQRSERLRVVHAQCLRDEADRWRHLGAVEHVAIGNDPAGTDRLGGRAPGKLDRECLSRSLLQFGTD